MNKTERARAGLNDRVRMRVTGRVREELYAYNQ